MNARDLDVGNLVMLEHLNLEVPDQLSATDFYINVLGLTRDPFKAVGTTNMHVNIGPHQIHLPSRGRQRFRGHVGLVLRDLDSLEQRLKAACDDNGAAVYEWRSVDGHLDVSCPQGNLFRCCAGTSPYTSLNFGLSYLELDVPPGAAAGIARFYRDVLGARVDGEQPTGDIQ